MKHLKAEFDKLSFKEVIVYWLAIVTMIVAMVAIFVSLYMPPRGEVHSSVLTYFGLSCAFVSTLLGITAHFNNQLNKFKTETIQFLRDNREINTESK